jgi:hypothetical protein
MRYSLSRLAVERGERLAHNRFMLRMFFAALPLVALAACVAPSRPAPVAEPTPAPAPAPVATPAPSPPPPAASNWADWPRTPGDWTWRTDARGTIASFGEQGRDAELTLRCDRQAGALLLARRGSAPGNATATIRTTSTARTLAMQPTGDGYATIRLAPRDAIVDAMGFSRGQFVIEMPPMAPLVAPSWAEILRVAEDCRG